VQQVRQYAESDNLVLLTVVLEFYYVVALVAINNKQPVRPSRGRLYIGVKVLKLR
jgi:hypothetical protein